jgi:diacylglycerol diphosphate phosphatase / phosphatidate phosphatase
MSFAGLTYLALYFSGRLRLFAAYSPHGKHIYSYLLTAAPLLVASFVASSRVSDFRHRGSDVLGGTSIGVFFGIMGYRYYFPWPQSQMAGVPWMIVRQEGELNVATGGNARGHNSNTETQLPLLPTSHDARSLGHGSQTTTTPYYDPGNPMELHSIPPANTYSDRSHAM